MRHRTLAALALALSLAGVARGEDSARRLDAICATTFDARVDFRLGEIPVQDAVEGAMILRSRQYDYALVGYPADAPLDATVTTIDGRTLTYLAPIVDGVALIRADRAALPLLADVQEASYAGLMTLPVEAFRGCEALGATVRARPDHHLRPDEEDLAARCGQVFASGPESGFLCSGGRFAFLRFFDTEYFLTDRVALPRAYLGGSMGDALGEPMAYRLGTPVFELEESRRIGFVSAIRTDGLVSVVPAENVVPYAIGIATRSETP